MDNKPAKVKAIDRTVERLAAKYGISDEDAANINHMLHSVVESRDRRLRHIENLLERNRYIAEQKIAPTRKKIAGALKTTITAHGPITSSLIGSTARRIVSALHCEGLHYTG